MKYNYDISVLVSLPRQDAETIWLHAASHPDTKFYTTQGQFLFPFVNIYKDQDIEDYYTFRQIDIMLKALEWPLGYKHLTELRNKLRQYCDAINAESDRLSNPPPVEKPLTRYKCRAECEADVLLFLQTYTPSFFNVKVDLYEHDIITPDEVLIFDSDKTLDELIAIMRKLDDCHVMYQTLKPIAEYTGERDYSL